MKSAPLVLALLLCILSLFTTTVVHAGTNAEGLAYLAAKGKEEGVVTLPSGLLYKELRPGDVDGKTPTLNSPCECDYAGTLIDGTEFDSSYKRGQPLTFAPNQVIKVSERSKKYYNYCKKISLVYLHTNCFLYYVLSLCSMYACSNAGMD